MAKLLSAPSAHMMYQGMQPVSLPFSAWSQEMWPNVYDGPNVYQWPTGLGAGPAQPGRKAKSRGQHRGQKTEGASYQAQRYLQEAKTSAHPGIQPLQATYESGRLRSLEEELNAPEQFGESKEKCDPLMRRLEEADQATRHELIILIVDVAFPLAMSSKGCRLVQKALELADSNDLDKLVATLRLHTLKLYDSENGNHVLSKMIEVTPSSELTVVISQLVEHGAVVVARHRFGCRVLERLIEHCTEDEAGVLLDQLIASASTLCRHAFGNFVVKQLLDHDSPHRRSQTLAQLISDLPYLASHKTASHVVQKALERGSEEEQQLIVETLLQAESPHSIVEIACSRYGSFVGKQLATLQSPWARPVHQRIVDRLPELVNDQYGKNVAIAFGLASGKQ